MVFYVQTANKGKMKMCIRDVYVKPIGDELSSPLFYSAQITDTKLLLVNGRKLDAMIAIYPESPQIPLTTRFWLDLLKQEKTENIINVCSLLPCKSLYTAEYNNPYYAKRWRIKETREELCFNWYCFRKHTGNGYCELHQDELEYELIFGGSIQCENYN